MVIETILSVFLGVHAIHGDGDGGSGTEDPRAPGPSSSASRQQLRRPRERSRSGERVEDDCNKRFRWTSEASVFDVGDVGDVGEVDSWAPVTPYLHAPHLAPPSGPFNTRRNC